MCMPEMFVVPNDLLLSRAVQAVAQGQVAKIPVRGHSMDPFIRGKHDCVELYPPVDVRIGDLVLAKVTDEQYMLHRIFRFEGDTGVVLMGDGNVDKQEFCHRKDIKAKALVIVSENGKRTRLDSRRMKAAARVWRWLLPCRGVLLRIFRKLFR